VKPDSRFRNKDKAFWAAVRIVGQEVGYTARGEGVIKVPTAKELPRCFRDASLDASAMASPDGSATRQAKELMEYLEFRADVLNSFVEPRLMDAAEAEERFTELRNRLKPKCPLPMNKQKGEKRAPAYLTGMVNMMVEANIGGLGCDYDPRKLTVVTRDGIPLRTLARRIDGAFPSALDPIAIWEIKEYYHTTTFGSRVADGVYETLLDGMELEELWQSEGVHVLHYLMLDSHYTWWECGRSYLCRVIDMLHMGYVDEVLFGSEVLERLPSLVSEWISLARRGAT
jgi:hypothetical protein